MKKLSLLLSLIPIVFTYAQNLDSLYNAFLCVKGLPQTNDQQIISDESEVIKCGFGVINQVKQNYDNFSLQQKKTISSMLQRPAADTSFVTPKGRFRIHYRKNGNDAPLYDLKDLAIAADSTYNYEINILGYPVPPNDDGAGGDNLYDIYIQNLPTGQYGFTEFEKSITEFTYTSFMVIDNDFGNGYYTHGIDGARVTLAHEFHHAIQIGNYIYRSSDNYFYELTSSSMEEIVFNDINDYYYFMDSYFRNPQRAFASFDGYGLAIWNLFLRDRFGVNIIKKIWELMPNKRALLAFGDAIQQMGSDFKVEFNKFGQWTYFTNKRTQPSKYFKEASSYPLVNPMVITGTITVHSEAVSNNFFQMNNTVSGVRDSLVMLVSNCDVEGGISSPSPTLAFTYSLSTQPISEGKQVSSNYYSKLLPVNTMLVELNILTGLFSFAEIDYAYPQPFSYSKNSQLVIPVFPSPDGTATLNIYSVDMSLIYSRQMSIDVSGKILWNGLDQNNKKLGTSVYIYVTESGGQIKKGKIIIYND